MKTVQLRQYGQGPAGLDVVEIAEPAPPGPGQALVRVEFAPINGNDLMVVAGIYDWRPALPAVIGNEGSGVVAAVGPGATGVQVGDRVVLPFMSHTWREQIVVDAADLVVVPPDGDAQQAAMLSINPVTAALLLTDFVDLHAGDAIVFNLATSGLARWLIALAGRRGIRTVGLVRRDADVAGVEAAGCDLVISDEEDAPAAKAKLAGLDVRLALDGVAGAASGRIVQFLADGGTLVSFGGVSREPMQLPSPALIFRQITVKGYFEGRSHNSDRVAGIVRDLAGMIGPGGVRQPVAAVYPAEQAREAVGRAAGGGRVLLAFNGAEQQRL